MRTSLRPSDKTAPRVSHVVRVDLLPRALGRDAFWKGRPIWSNPFAGDPAREWSAGWHSGVTELRGRSGLEELPSPDDSIAWRSLIRTHRD